MVRIVNKKEAKRRNFKIQSIPRALNPKLDCNVRDDDKKYRENNMEINFHFHEKRKFSNVNVNLMWIANNNNEFTYTFARIITMWITKRVC